MPTKKEIIADIENELVNIRNVTGGEFTGNLEASIKGRLSLTKEQQIALIENMSKTVSESIKRIRLFLQALK